MSTSNDSESPSCGANWHPALRWLAIIPAMILIYLAALLASLVTSFIFEMFANQASDDVSVAPILFFGFAGFAMVTTANDLATAAKSFVTVLATVAVVVLALYNLPERPSFYFKLIDVAQITGAVLASYQRITKKVLFS